MVGTPLLLDFSRPPNARESDALTRRLSRLERSEASVSASVQHFAVMSADRKPSDALRFRVGYSVLASPANPGGSDRVLPPRENRPPVTRLMSPRGAALRLHLLALADAQFRGRPGRATKNVRPIRTVSPEEPGWSSLLASEAVMKGDGKVYMTAKDKRVRQIQSALDALKVAGLVELPHYARGAGKYEEFELLEETSGMVPGDDPIRYLVPKMSESTFWLPDGFVTEGWVHLLADTEIALLLMVACGRHSIESEAVAIPAFHRVQHYGVGRDAFEAHLWLQRFGLLEVHEVGRHSDGRSEEYEEEGASLHRLSLRPEGLAENGARVVRAVIEGQLARAPGA